ncbi:MAG: HAMP domain-containing protein [Acidobacteria bacterium]|nr:HAMP domain-containing protein [Acidobacteriota bacterium]
MIRTLFLKIFLSFWLAQVAFLALMFVTAARPQATQQAIARRKQLMQDSIAFNAQNAIQMLNSQDAVGAQRYLVHIEDSSGISMSLFDGAGGRLAGPVPSASALQMLPVLVRGGKAQLRDVGTNTLAGQPVNGPDGRRYYVVGELRRSASDAIGRFSELAFWPLVVWVIASGGVCFWLARYLTSPVVKLRRASQQLAEGDLSARAGETVGTGRGELADLVRDFDRMAERIQSLVDSQNQLLSDVSHELRSPLARLSVAIGVARRRAGAEAGASLDRIELEAERLNELITRVLMLCRLEVGEDIAQEEVPIDVGALVGDIITDANFEAQSRQCFVICTSSQPCTVAGNLGLLRSAIENVVRNAMRYSAENSAVEVSVRRHRVSGRPACVIAVRDHGPGIPDDQLEEIFRPFYRLEDARERQTGGSGLGLAIAQRAIRLHHGSARAMNAPGGGLLVEMTIPTVSPSEVTGAGTPEEAAVRPNSYARMK